MKRRAIDSTLAKRAVCVKPPNTWDAYFIRGGTRPLFMDSIWEGKKLVKAIQNTYGDS